MLAFVVDLSAGFSEKMPDVQGSKHPTGADLPPWDAVELLRRELALYDSELPVTPALVVANKIDRLPDPDAQLAKLRCKGGPAPYTVGNPPSAANAMHNIRAGEVSRWGTVRQEPDRHAGNASVGAEGSRTARSTGSHTTAGGRKQQAQRRWMLMLRSGLQALDRRRSAKHLGLDHMGFSQL